MKNKREPDHLNTLAAYHCWVGEDRVFMNTFDGLGWVGIISIHPEVNQFGNWLVQAKVIF